MDDEAMVATPSEWLVVDLLIRNFINAITTPQSFDTGRLAKWINTATADRRRL